MNLSEALDAALPEMPKTRLARARPPRLDPGLIVRHESIDGEPVVGVFKRETSLYFRLDPAQWQLALLFDGARSFEEIAEECTATTGSPMSAAEARAFADTLEESDFWYKTPQEKNIALNQKLIAQRGRRATRKSRMSLAHIGFSAWDPDRYLTWLDSRIGKYIYSPWCVLTCVLLFGFEASVFIGHWSVLGPDTALYFNFTEKSFSDIAQFWLLVFFLGFIHETAHGLTCKHYGGQVHQMGFMFLYLVPCFYCDVTEIWISATLMQRLATIIAGIWVELVVCGFAMILWLNTSAGAWLHDLSYQMILITGIAVVVLNLNPLIKLDGYYLLTEVIGIQDLKERSTLFLSGWFQSRILRLNTEMLVIPSRRAPLFILYAAVSGIYSYAMLFFVIRLSFNIGRHWLGEFAIIPSVLLFLRMFKSRLQSMRNTVVQLWEQKLGGKRLFRPIPLLLASCIVALIFVPLWRDRENAYFVIEPLQSETLHAAVPGQVTEVLVREGEKVHAGQPMLRMTSSLASSMANSAIAQTHEASFQAFDAELRGQSIGQAAAQQQASRNFRQLAGDAQSSLVVATAEDGIVLTKDPGSLLGRQVSSGQALLDVAADGPRAVRVYIPSAALQRIPSGAGISLEIPGRFSPIHLKLVQPGAEAVSLPEGLVPSQKYKGVTLPVFYSARMPLPASAGSLRFGEAGRAKIFGIRRSLAGRVFALASDIVRAHLW